MPWSERLFDSIRWENEQWREELRSGKLDPTSEEAHKARTYLVQNTMFLETFDPRCDPNAQEGNPGDPQD